MRSYKLLYINYLLILVICSIILWSGDAEIISGAESGRVPAESVKPELVLQTGHGKSVDAIIFSSDNRWAASGGFDNTIKIWDFETGRELRALTGHGGAVKALAGSFDGRLLASGGNDRTVLIWDVESGRTIKSFPVRDGAITAIAFSPDGKKIAFGGSANTVFVNDVESGAEIFNFSEHTGAITTLAFGLNGEVLASGSADGTIKIWELAKGRRIKNLKGHAGQITALQFSADGEMLASGSADQTVRLWKPLNGRELAILKGHGGRISGLNFVSGGKLVSSDSDYTIKVWETTDGRAVSSVNARGDISSVEEMQAAAFSPDGRFWATSSGDRKVVLSDVKTGVRLQTLENRTSGFYGAVFSSDRRWLAAASFDNTVKLWDLQTGQGLSPLAGHTGYVTAVVFHPDNRRVISASVDGTIRIWDAVNGKTLRVLSGHTGIVSSLAIGGRGRLLASGGVDRKIRLWDLETNEPIGELSGHTAEVTSVAISPDEQIIASAGMDRTVKLWNAQTRVLLRTLEGHAAEVDAVAFSPDGQFLASGSLDKTVRVWETATGNWRQTLTGHAEKINAVAFSADGKQIASGSQDKTVRLWNAASGQPERTLNGHVGTVFSSSFSADGQWLVSGSEDGSLIVWKTANGNRLSTLISLNNSDDWLVVTPEGFFDGSPAAWEQLLWRFEKNTFNVKPVEVFFNEFYAPGLLGNLLAGGGLPATVDIAGKDRRQPVVKISLGEQSAASEAVGERRIKVKIQVAESAPGDGYQKGSGARDVRLFRNGSLVKLWSGDVLKNTGKTELETTVAIVKGKNQLTAYAFNDENVKSSDAHLIVNGAENLQRRGVFYIFAVGVGEYSNPKYNLNYVNFDAKEFGEQLLRKQSELKQFERVEFVPLFNREATKTNILAAIKRLAGIDDQSAAVNLPAAIARLRRGQPEDTVAIFFSGHGTSQNNRFYVLPHDLGYSDPNALLDGELLKSVLSHSISDTEMEQAFREIDVGNLILVVDACNSGQALEAEDSRSGPMNSKGLAQLAYDKGMYILTAAQSAESAYVSQALKRSYLSYALVEEALKTPVADAAPPDGKLSVREWFAYAADRVPRLRQDVLSGALKIEQGKGLEEREQAAQIKGTQRPRAFYRRQTTADSLIVSATQ